VEKKAVAGTRGPTPEGVSAQCEEGRRGVWRQRVFAGALWDDKPPERLSSPSPKKLHGKQKPVSSGGEAQNVRTGGGVWEKA